MRSPDRGATIAAAGRGKPRTRSVIESIRKANTGKTASEATRRKMSEAHKRRGTIPPALGGPLWTKGEDALLGTMKDQDVAKRFGRTLDSVRDLRYHLGLPNIVKGKPISKPPRWTSERERLLGTMSDTDLPLKLCCSPLSVFRRRRKLKIPRYRGPR
jgi:hypothetical protein